MVWWGDVKLGRVREDVFGEKGKEGFRGFI